MIRIGTYNQSIKMKKDIVLFASNVELMIWTAPKRQSMQMHYFLDQNVVVGKCQKKVQADLPI